MTKAKITAETRSRPVVPPSVEQQPPELEKAPGRALGMVHRAMAADLPPPDGRPSPVRAASALSISSPAGAAGRARLSRELQQTVGNARMGRMLGIALAENDSQALPAASRKPMESAFGRDFGGVRVHTSPAAAGAAEDLGAKAFTQGQDIFFARGQFQPDSQDGQRLLAHELTHTVQGKNGAAADDGVTVSHPNDHHEVEARRVAEAVVAGQPPAPITNAATPAISRDGPPAQPPPPPPPPTAAPAAPAAPPVAPEHRNQKVATWTGWLDSSVRTSSVLGEQAIAQYGTPVGAIPTTLTRPGWTAGHYPSEAAATAAIGAAGTAGAVFSEGGQFVSYHATGDGTVYSFTLDNLRWFSDKPWTALRFDSAANAIVTNDGAILRKEHYKTKDDAKTAVADQALMPGDQDPFTGFQQAFGDLNKPGTLELVFYPAMKASALAALAKGRPQVEREIERRSSSGLVTPEEMKQMRDTAFYLAGLDQEIAGIPQTIPPDPDQVQRFWALQQRRRVVLARYPILTRVDPRQFVKLSETDQQTQLGGEATKVLKDIDDTRNNIFDGSLNLWKIKSLVESTLAGLGVRDPVLRKRIQDLASANETSLSENTIQIFAIVFGIASAFVSGPLGLALAAGAFGLGVADAIKQTEDMLAESSAANTALDPKNSVFSPEELKSWGWLVVAWIGVVADAAQVASAIRAVRAAGNSIEAGVKVLAKGDPKRFVELSLAAGLVDSAEVITLASKATVARRLGTAVEINASLGKEIRVYYSVNSRGRIVLEGVRCGPEARVAEVLAHAPVIRELQRYDGLLGRMRELIDRLLSFAGFTRAGANPFPAGSQAFESYLELGKLDEIISLRRAQLGRELGKESEAVLRRDIQFLESELAHHQIVVDQMTLEKGVGYIARAEEQTTKAIASGKVPPLQGNPLITDASKYYYRVNPAPPPDFTLTRFANAGVPPRVLVADGSGGWKIAEGALSRAEQATAMIGGWPKEFQDAFQAFETAYRSAGRVVPLQGVATTGKKIRQIIEPAQQQGIYTILEEAFRRAKDPDPAARATSALTALLDHDITLVKGTDQLRAFNYRLAFAKQTGAEASGDLHHLVPLYLGGDNTRLVDVAPDLHDRLHDLVDLIRLDAGTTLAPASVRGSASFSFTQGAAVLKGDGTVQLARLNADGTFALVP